MLFSNTDAFVPTNQVPRGIYGNAGRGLISGPAFQHGLRSIIKDFVFREPYKLQFRSEFFNAFNQVRIISVTTAVTSGAFGRIRAASEGRGHSVCLEVPVVAFRPVVGLHGLTTSRLQSRSGRTPDS